MRALWLVASLAIAGPGGVAVAVAGEQPVAEQASAGAEEARDDAQQPEAAATASRDSKFVPPPGYKRMKRGKHELWCRKETEIGSRFASLKCYDEATLKALVEEREKTNRDFEQRRSLCSNPAVCATQ